MKKIHPQKDERQIVLFRSPKEWARWLSKNHSGTIGVWVRFFKKGSGEKSITYSEALDEALCYGWIDSQLHRYDAKSYIQKFTPRRSKSIWSRSNTGHIERLIQEGRMKPPGMKEVEAAKADGRWNAAYDSPGNMKFPVKFLKELSKSKKAKVFFDTLNSANKYAIAWRLQTAKKSETREKRMKTILEMLEEKKKFH